MYDASVLDGKQHLHFIGVGGSGMFPLVQILLGRGYKISGSDNNPTETLEIERRMGVDVTIGQRAENIEGADLIVYTAAILPDNPELIAARESGVPLLERAELLGLLSREFARSICVSGTHGKTTTSSMLSEILLAADKDPTIVVGGKLASIGGSGRAGGSDLFVCEACEFANHHLLLNCSTAVILNIDADHLEFYGSIENIMASFRTFAEGASQRVVANGDDANTRTALAGLGDKVCWFGRSDSSDYYPADYRYDPAGHASFALMHRGKPVCDLVLHLPGEHNVLNAIAACVCALDAGCTPEQVAQGLAAFRGVGRRFEILGEVGGITIADDYAHHPAELEATLKAAKQMGYNAVWAVFQPFTYSRTALLLDDFARVLPLADHVVMSEIMGGREKNTYNIKTADLAAKIPGSVWFETFEEIAKYVMGAARPGDLVITMGCGDVDKCAKIMLNMLNK